MPFYDDEQSQRVEIETVDLRINPKQSQFFNDVIAAAWGKNPYRYFFYGGAIRGGKTFVCLSLLVVLSKMFPFSKWHIVRKNFSTLKDTTMPSMERVLGQARVAWNRDPANYHCTFPNQSKIFFIGENIQTDPELNAFLGLESNGFFLEQIEELQIDMFNMAIQRTGSWYINPMPKPLILSTFNPTNRWVKKMVYDKHVDGTLEPPYYYLQALPKENPKVTEEQWKGWENMDEKQYARFVEGSWDFGIPDNLFIYAFDERKHLDDTITCDNDKPVYLSFDFNVEPITCLVCQHDVQPGFIHILQEFRLMNSDIYELCARVKTSYGDRMLIVTGDATGRGRQAISRGNRNYYQVIQQELMLSAKHVNLPPVNPSVDNTRVLCNAIFAKHGRIKIHPRCQFLIDDIESVTTTLDGDIDKTKDAHKTHLLDCMRYYFWTYHRNFVTIIQS